MNISVDIYVTFYIGVWIRTNATAGQSCDQDPGEGSVVPAGAVPLPHAALHGGDPWKPQNIRQTLLRVWVLLRVLHGPREDHQG